MNYQQLIGQYLGKYKIDAFQREEPFAIVFRGHHESLDRIVTIKILLPSPTVDYFLSCAQKLVTLEHENIASIYDITFDERLRAYYVVEQAIEGNSLASVIEQQGKFSLQDSIKFIKDLLPALALATEKGIVHGNLAPFSIVYSVSQNIWKIIDFGLPPVQMISGVLTYGRLGYISPEQLEGQFPSFAGDVYSLGCIFFQLLTGKLPIFEDVVKKEVPEKNLQEHTRISPPTTKRMFPLATSIKQPVFPAFIPSDIQNCLNYLLAWKASQRINFNALISEIEKLWNKYNQIFCPRCGKSNSILETFHCKKCNTSGLCLSHIVPEEQCCDHCAKLKDQTTSKNIEGLGSWNKLIELLYNIANNNRQGVLLLGGSSKEFAITITPDGLELHSLLAVPKMLAGLSQEEHFRQIFYAYLRDFMQQLECDYEFWENDIVKKVLPNASIKSQLFVNSSEFLITIAQIFQLFRDTRNFSGICISTLKRTIGLSFNEQGVIFGILGTANEESWEIYTDLSVVEDILGSFFDQTPVQIQYRQWHKLANYSLPTLSFSYQHFLDMLSLKKSWVAIGNLLPEIHSYIATLLHSQRAMNSQDIIKYLLQYVNPKSVQEATDFNMLYSLFFTTIIIKERLLEASKYLLYVFQTSAGISFKYGENLLLQALKLSPENLELYEALAKLYENNRELKKAAEYYAMIGSLHLKTKNFGLALPNYEKAVALDSKHIKPKISLLELYEQLEQREKLQQFGLDLFMELKKKTLNRFLFSNKKEQDLIMEKICQILLKNDSGLVICHNEMIHIARRRKDKILASQHYDMLIQLYQRINNKQAMLKTMTELIRLDATRTDIRKKIQEHGDSLVLHNTWLRFLGVVWLLVFLAFIIWQYRIWWDSYDNKISSTLAHLQSQNITRKNWNVIKTQTWGLLEQTYSPVLKTEITDFIIRLYQTKENIETSQEKEIQNKIFGSLKEVLDLCKKWEKWEQAHEICLLGISIYPNRQKDILPYQEFFQNKITQIYEQAELLYQQAQELEKNDKTLPHAIDKYFQIVKNESMKNSPAAQKIMIPVQIVSNIDNVFCYDGDKNIGKTPLVYLYKYPHIPNIIGRYTRGKRIETKIFYTPEKNIAKIYFIVK